MKKTLLITLEFPPDIGGVGSYYANLCAGLPKDNIIVLANANRNEHPSEWNGVKIYRMPLLSRTFYPRWLTAIRRSFYIIKKEKIDELWIGQVLPIGYVGFFCKIFLNIPYIVFCHGTDVSRPRRSFRKRTLAGFIMKHSRHVIANSFFIRDIVRSYSVSSDRIKIVYPSVIWHDRKADIASSRIMKKAGISPNQPIILSVGRIIEQKGFQTAIRAFRSIAHENKNFVYVIVGDGYYRSVLEALVRDFRLEKRVIFIGAVSDRDEIAAMYRACTVFIMLPFGTTTNGEGFGIVYLEANFFGKPVIGTESGGISEAVINNVTGILVPAGNVEQAAGAIRRILYDAQFARKLGEQGRERVICDFSPAKQAEALGLLIKS